MLCGKIFGKPERACSLDEGHLGDCAGPIRAGVRKAAKAARARLNAEEERRQREAILHAGNGVEEELARRVGLPLDLSPAQFAAAILENAGQGGATIRELLGRLREQFGQGFSVNRIPIRAQEIRQAAARLERDGMASYDGDTVRSLATTA